MSVVRFRDGITGTHGPRLARDTDERLHHRLIPSRAPAKLLETIVVPLDGSQFAEHAIPLAISIAKRSGGVLKLVRVFMPAEVAIRRRQWDAFDIMEGRLRTEAGLDLDRVQRKIAARAPEVLVTAHVVEARRAIEGLIPATETADLVVMATRRRGWLGRFFLGCVGHDMLHNRKRPTIYVRGYDSPVDFSADPAPRHLAIALDGRRAYDRVLDVAAAVARTSRAKSTLLHVVEPHEIGERFPHGTAQGFLNWTQKEFSKLVRNARTHVIRKAVTPAQGILEFLDEAEPDLLAVTARAAPGTFGSTTENLVRKSSVPVLVVRE